MTANRKPLTDKQRAALAAAVNLGPISDKTKAEIAAHRARYLERREQRGTDRAPTCDHTPGKPVTVVDADGFVIIRPARPEFRCDGETCSGMMPLEGGAA